MAIKVKVSLGDDGLPTCTPDPVPVKNAGNIVIQWEVDDQQIEAITAIDGLPDSVFDPPPAPQGSGKKWSATDKASRQTNGRYKYDISVRLSSGEDRRRDPEVHNDIPP